LDMEWICQFSYLCPEFDHH